MARAKTGTGKTMAFLIPAIEALVRWVLRASSAGRRDALAVWSRGARRRPDTSPPTPAASAAARSAACHLCRDPPRGSGNISVLVLSPTRELASQIAKEAEALLKFHPFKAQVVYGV